MQKRKKDSPSEENHWNHIKESVSNARAMNNYTRERRVQAHAYGKVLKATTAVPLTEHSILAASLILFAMPKCIISTWTMLCSSGVIKAP